VNGVAVRKPSEKFKSDQILLFAFPVVAEYTLVPSTNEVPVLYQDQSLAIIHKPADITVHPGAGTGDDTLVHILVGQMDNLSEGNDPSRPGIVHRLDRATEGLMVIAKNNNIHHLLSAMFQKREVIKEYHAWVWGHPIESEKIEGYIGRHPTDRKKMLFSDTPLNHTYKLSVLSYKVIQENEFGSLLKILLKTGRTHQIRATFSARQFPLIGDVLYSRVDRKIKKEHLEAFLKNKIEHAGLLLIASRLAFHHPVTNEWLDYSIDLPERFLLI